MFHNTPEERRWLKLTRKRFKFLLNLRKIKIQKLFTFQDSTSIAMRMMKPPNLQSKKTKTKHRRFQQKMERRIIFLIHPMDFLKNMLRNANQCGKPSEIFFHWYFMVALYFKFSIPTKTLFIISFLFIFLIDFKFILSKFNFCRKLHLFNKSNYNKTLKFNWEIKLNSNNFFYWILKNFDKIVKYTKL